MGEQIITTEVDSKRLELAIRLFPRQLKMNLGDAFDHIGRHFLKEWRAKQLQGPPGIRGQSRNFFGRFKRTLLLPTGGDINNMGLEIFTDSKVAAQHEKGGVVTSQDGGYIPVPLSVRAELFTGRGLLKRQYRKPAQLKNVVPIRFNEKTFLARVKKKSKEVTPLYVLKKSVRLKPRLGFFKIWDSMVNWRMNRLNQAVGKTINEV